MVRKFAKLLGRFMVRNGTKLLLYSNKSLKQNDYDI